MPPHRLPFGSRLLRGTVLVLLSGCASSGTNYDPAKADALTPGVSTQAEATKALGKPNNETFLADSTTMLTWLHSTGTAWGTGKSRYLSILFDREGRMVRIVQRGQTNTQ
jgi:hypothetical protein